ncbi:uncharacterized protein [Atheta coriaria]|uniref:uncharacterized protein n=1 Tax=Dalotia coriaria TaxID=877792 RepID=UPI0031F3E2A7
MSTNKMALIKAIRDRSLIYQHNLNDEQVGVVCGLIEAIGNEDKKKILEILEPWSDELKDEYLSISCKYLLDQNIPISYNISEFVGISLLTLRFYSPDVGKQLQTCDNETNILEYMMKHMDAILIWKGPTDKILLYHIKQVVLMANEVKYLFRSETEKLPWIKLIFYCVQYIKCCNRTNDPCILSIFMSNDKLIKYIKLWKIGLENMNSTKIMQDQKIQYMLKNFEHTYDDIRDYYSVKRMRKYCSVRQSFLSNLRMLQVFGECLKNKSQTPNVSLRLKERLKSQLGTVYDNLTKLRDTISHLTGIPECTQDVINEVSELMDKFLLPLINQVVLHWKKLYFVSNSVSEHLIKTINQEIKDAPKLPYNDCLKQLEDALNNNKEQKEIEMLLMIILNNLKKQRRLNANWKWFMEIYPTLTGLQLRNHLAHGDPIVELMDVNEEMAVRHTAKMLIKELYDESKEKIEKVTKRPAIEMMQDIDNQQITRFEEQEKLFQIIIEGDLEKFKDYLQNISSEWINWQSLNQKNALQYAAVNKNDNLELFQFVLEKSPSYMEQIKTDSSLLFQASNNFKIAKRIAELHICALLENDRTYLQPNDNNDILELCKKLIKTEKINSFWNVCYYQISCDDVDNLKLMLDEIYYWKFLISYERKNSSWFQIAYNYNATEVMKYLINIGYTINNSTITNEEIVKYCDIEKQKELRKIIKSGQVFKEKECIKKSTDMLEQSHNDDFNVMNCLHFAIKSGNPEMVKQVYQSLPILLFSVDNEGNSPLGVAIKQNCVQEFNILMELVVNNTLKLPQLFKTWAIGIIDLQKSNIVQNNNVVIENVLTSTINAMDMNPKEKTVQYWAIKLAKSMLGYYNSNEHLINRWKQIAINTLFHFPDESLIVKECIDIVVEIFDHKLSAQPEYNIAKQLDSILDRCARYSHPSVILEKLYIALQNKIEYGHWSKIIAHHAKYVIETFRDNPHIQLYALKLIHGLTEKKERVDVSVETYRVAMQRVIPKYYNDIDAMKYCVELFVDSILANNKYVSADSIISIIDNELQTLGIDDNSKKKFKQMIEKERYYLLHLIHKTNFNTVDAHLKCIDYNWTQCRDKHKALERAAQNINDDVELFKLILSEYLHYLTEISINKYINILLLAEGNGNTQIVIHILHTMISKSIAEMNHDLNDYHFKSVLLYEWYYAVFCDDVDFCRTFVELNYTETLEDAEWKLDYRIKFGNIACIHGATRVVEYLISIGYDFNHYLYNSITPLDFSIKYGHNEITQMLIQNGATVEDLQELDDKNQALLKSYNTEKHEELWRIIESGEVDKFNEYIENTPELFGPCRFTDGMNCLHFAVLSENPEMVKQVYQRLPHLLMTTNKKFETPLDIIVSGNLISVLDMIIDLVLNDRKPEIFEYFVSTLYKSSYTETIIYAITCGKYNKLLKLIEKYPQRMIVNYWAIMLINDMSIISLTEDQLTTCVTLAENAFTAFMNEPRICQEWILFAMRIFLLKSEIHVDRYKRNTIYKYVLNYIAKYPNILNFINNELETYETLLKKTESWKCEILQELAKYAIDTYPEDSDVLEFAFILLHECRRNEMELSITFDLQSFIKTVLETNIPFRSRETKIKRCGALVWHYYTKRQTTSENMEETIESEVGNWDIHEGNMTNLLAAIAEHMPNVKCLHYFHKCTARGICKRDASIQQS